MTYFTEAGDRPGVYRKGRLFAGCFEVRYRSKFFVSALAVLAALAFAGCGAGKSTPAATDVPEETRSSEESEERILQLAEACDGFGEFDYDDGVRQSEAERMIYCLHRFDAQESEVAGYAKVGEEPALRELAGVFPAMELPQIVRTKYDQSGEQEIFYLNDAFYVKMCARQGVTYRVVSVTDAPEGQAEGGASATVEALDGGVPVKRIRLTLIPNDGFYWSVIRCEFLYMN